MTADHVDRVVYTPEMYEEYARVMVEEYRMLPLPFDKWVGWNRYMDASELVRDVDIEPDVLEGGERE